MKERVVSEIEKTIIDNLLSLKDSTQRNLDRYSKKAFADREIISMYNAEIRAYCFSIQIVKQVFEDLAEEK